MDSVFCFFVIVMRVAAALSSIIPVQYFLLLHSDLLGFFLQQICTFFSVILFSDLLGGQVDGTFLSSIHNDRT